MAPGADICFQESGAVDTGAVVSCYCNIIVRTQGQVERVVRRQVSALAYIQIEVKSAGIVYSECDKAFAGIIDAFQVVDGIRQRPREPECDGCVHVGYVDDELVRKVAAEVTGAVVLVNVTVVISARQIGPRYRVGRYGNRRARINFSKGCKVL